MIIILTISTVLMCNAAAAHELHSLYGVRGGNKATLCMAPGRQRDQCDGAVWSPNWILVRGSCVADRAMYPVIIFRKFTIACDAVAPDRLTAIGRRVRARFLHPSYPAVDYALISFVSPYEDLEPDRNDSRAIISKLEHWIMETTTQYSPTIPRTRYTPDERNMMFSSPIKMFVTTVVLPLTFFIVFFIFVTFYTGKSTVSYTILNDKEDSPSV